MTGRKKGEDNDYKMFTQEYRSIADAPDGHLAVASIRTGRRATDLASW